MAARDVVDLVRILVLEHGKRVVLLADQEGKLVHDDGLESQIVALGVRVRLTSLVVRSRAVARRKVHR